MNSCNLINDGGQHYCDWFVDNKLSTHFVEDKTNCILFSTDTNLPELKITYNNNRIKQYGMIEYIGCCLDTNLSGKSMTMKFLRKINTKLQFLYRMLVFIGSLSLTTK